MLPTCAACFLRVAREDRAGPVGDGEVYHLQCAPDGDGDFGRAG